MDPRLEEYIKQEQRKAFLKRLTFSSNEDGWEFTTILFQMPNITWDVLERESRPSYDYRRLEEYAEYVRLEDLRIKERCIAEWNAAQVIKDHYLRAFWDSRTHLGKKRLERSYNSGNYNVW